MSLPVLTYNLEKDMNSGAIEVHSPNFVNDRFNDYEHLMSTAKMQGVKPLKCAKSMMSMYKLNYGGKEHYPEAKKRISAWESYIKNKIT